MKDRITLTPNRVKLIPVAGMANTYDIVRADNPTQEGTALNKANLLSDSLAAALGIDNKPEGGTVNDALGVLAPKADYSRSFVRNTEPTDEGKEGDVWVNTTANRVWIKYVGEWKQLITRLPTYGKTLNEYSWDEISYIAKMGLAELYFKMGDTKSLVYNGNSVTAQIVAFRHDDVSSADNYGGNKAELTFAFYTNIQMASSLSNVRYSASLAKQTLDNAALSDGLTDVIVPVIKKTGYNASTLETTNERLWLFSAKELDCDTLDYIHHGDEEGDAYTGFAGYSNSNGWIRSHPSASSYYSSSYRYFGVMNQGHLANVTNSGSDYNRAKQNTDAGIGAWIGFCV